MQQMASLGLLLTIFAGLGQFTTTGGTAVQGHLFQPCANPAAAVGGILYSIDVTEGASFIRAVLKEGKELLWTDTGLGADQGVVQCAFKALQVGALMYKYDGLCWVRLQGVSHDLFTTECGTGDVVYVLKLVHCLDGQFQCYDGTCLDGAKRCDDVKDCTSGSDERRCSLGCTPAEFECDDGECVPDTVTCDGTADCAGGEDELVCEFNMFRGERVKYGEYAGCYYSTPRGMTYGTSDRLVEENLPSKVGSCCPVLWRGACFYVDDIETQNINFCEASARCEASGFSMLSYEMMNPRFGDLFDAALDGGIFPLSFTLNYVRDGQGVWRWMPSGETDLPLFNFIKDPTIDQNCSVIDFRDFPNVGLVAMNCDDVVGHNSLCFQNVTQLPQCEELGGFEK